MRSSARETGLLADLPPAAQSPIFRESAFPGLPQHSLGLALRCPGLGK